MGQIHVLLHAQLTIINTNSLTDHITQCGLSADSQNLHGEDLAMGVVIWDKLNFIIMLVNAITSVREFW